MQTRKTKCEIKMKIDKKSKKLKMIMEGNCDPDNPKKKINHEMSMNVGDIGID